MKMTHMTCPGHEDATLEGYILDCELTFGQDTKRPAILVCPGGGYLYCSPREAEPVALRYAAAGFHAFVLRYSTESKAAGNAPLSQVSWAISLLREKAEKWNIDGEKIAVCGFSAGGHLALMSGLMAEQKPNAMILIYPAAVLPNLPGADFMLKVLTGKETVDDQDAAYYNLLNKITADAPPVFLAATAEDMITSFGALPIAQKYNEAGRQYELHIFQYGPHGYSVADVTSADGSSRMLNTSFAKWHGMSVDWLLRTFGEPTFVDKSTSRLETRLRGMGISIPEGQSI
jgi:acetyl esterase/lipase